MAICVAIAIIAAWAFLVRPAESRAAAARSTNAALQQNLMAANQQASRLPELNARVDQLRQQVGRFKPLRPRADLPSLQSQIAQLKDQFALRKFEIRQSPDKRLIDCVEQPFTIKFEASFEQTASFLAAVDSLNVLSRTRSLSIKQADARSQGAVRVDLTLSLYFSE
jgi:Tfp pilus assembly protein PilO